MEQEKEDKSAVPSSSSRGAGRVYSLTQNLLYR